MLGAGQGLPVLPDNVFESPTSRVMTAHPGQADKDRCHCGCQCADAVKSTLTVSINRTTFTTPLGTACGVILWPRSSAGADQPVGQTSAGCRADRTLNRTL